MSMFIPYAARISPMTTVVVDTPLTRLLLLPRLTIHREFYGSSLQSLNSHNRSLPLQLICCRWPDRLGPYERPLPIPMGYVLQRRRKWCRCIPTLGPRQRSHATLFLCRRFRCLGECCPWCPCRTEYVSPSYIIITERRFLVDLAKCRLRLRRGAP